MFHSRVLVESLSGRYLWYRVDKKVRAVSSVNVALNWRCSPVESLSKAYLADICGTVFLLIKKYEWFQALTWPSIDEGFSSVQSLVKSLSSRYLWYRFLLIKKYEWFQALIWPSIDEGCSSVQSLVESLSRRDLWYRFFWQKNTSGFKR